VRGSPDLKRDAQESVLQRRVLAVSVAVGLKAFHALAGAAGGQGGIVPGCTSPPGVRERARPARSGPRTSVCEGSLSNAERFLRQTNSTDLTFGSAPITGNLTPAVKPELVEAPFPPVDIYRSRLA
jgi:hypothetical protein